MRRRILFILALPVMLAGVVMAQRQGLNAAALAGRRVAGIGLR